MPFRKYSEAFAPEVLDAMTAAFNAAVQSAQIPLSEFDKKEIADRILASASSGDLAGGATSVTVTGGGTMAG